MIFLPIYHLYDDLFTYLYNLLLVCKELISLSSVSLELYIRVKSYLVFRMIAKKVANLCEHSNKVYQGSGWATRPIHKTL